MKKFLAGLGLFAGSLFFAPGCFAAATDSIISFTDTLATNSDGFTRAQTETANPALTELIADNNAHTIILANKQVSPYVPITFFSLRFNGTGTGCSVQLLDTNVPGSRVAYPVAAGQVFGMGIHPSTKFIYYIGCFN